MADLYNPLIPLSHTSYHCNEDLPGSCFGSCECDGSGEQKRFYALLRSD